MIAIGWSRDSRSRRNTMEMPSRDRSILVLNLVSPYFSIFFVNPQPNREINRASVVCRVLELSEVASRRDTDSTTCITLTWSRFLVRQVTTRPNGSISLSSITQLSALETIPRGNHLGSDPALRMRRVVCSVPEGVILRDMTSQARTWPDMGLG